MAEFLYFILNGLFLYEASLQIDCNFIGYLTQQYNLNEPILPTYQKKSCFFYKIHIVNIVHQIKHYFQRQYELRHRINTSTIQYYATQSKLSKQKIINTVMITSAKIDQITFNFVRKSLIRIQPKRTYVYVYQLCVFQ